MRAPVVILFALAANFALAGCSGDAPPQPQQQDQGQPPPGGQPPPQQAAIPQTPAGQNGKPGATPMPSNLPPLPVRDITEKDFTESPTNRDPSNPEPPNPEQNPAP